VLASATIGVYVSLDLFFLYFFYEMSVIPMYLLLAVWGSHTKGYLEMTDTAKRDSVGFIFNFASNSKEYAAMKLTLFLSAGAVVALALALTGLWAMTAPASTAILPAGLPDLPFHVRVDPLSGFFLLLLGGVTFGISLFAAGTLASFIGLLLPWMLSRVNIDPAFGSGPVATIIQDVLTILIYFWVMTLLLPGVG